MPNSRLFKTAGVVAVTLILLAGCTTGSKTEERIVKADDFVKVTYTGTLADGTVFDSSEGRDPLEFEVGSGSMIRGFDSAVQGMKLNETKTVTIPSADAYGPYRPELVATVPRAQLPAEYEPTVGTSYQANQPDGSVLIATVKEVNGDQVTLDANSPLADKDLTFTITVVEIREP